jgi:hypothetical protein
MTNLGYSSNEGAIPEFRIQLTGTQFELYVAHNSNTAIQANEYIEIKYSVYVPKYVDCNMLNWEQLNNVVGNNMKLSSYTFPNPSKTDIPLLPSDVNSTGSSLGVLEVLDFDKFDVLTGHVLKITVRVLNNTAADVDLNLTAYFRGFMQARKDCETFKIMGNVDVEQGVAIPDSGFDDIDDWQ